ncbi:MAG TPA: peptidase inhibitor I78 [Caulobacteraceae bacterium]|jgi:hypothetical protein|nr:peptidase inhibitor I78 [Caulobacteraceae bacterium]
MRRIGATAVFALVLAACAEGSAPAPPAASPPASPPAAPTPRAPAATPPVALGPAPISVPPPKPPDQCGAYALGGLIGRPRTEIPVPVDPAKRRVVCSTCPRTEDFRPDRLTIEYDQATGRVTKLGCN